MFRTLEGMQKGLDYHVDRHNVLASNVANLDTPGFVPNELVRVSAGEEREGELGLRATHRAHFGNSAEGGEAKIEERDERVIQPGGDGNAVSLEREMSKVAANDIRYDAISTMVRQHIGLLSYAASDTQRG